MMVISAAELTRVRICPTPGCPNEIVRGDFCETCKVEIPARRRKAITRQFVMTRVASLDTYRRTRPRSALAERERHQRVLVDGRHRALVTFERLAGQASRRGDLELALVLERARRFAARELGVELAS